MSGSNCCFLSFVQVSQETGKVDWYSHLLKNFPQFVVIDTVKSFSVVNEAEVDVFLEVPCILSLSLSFFFFWSPVNIFNFLVYLF